MLRGFALHRRRQQQLEHEAVVVGRKLAVAAAGQRLRNGFVCQGAGGLRAPARAVAEEGKHTGGDELPGGLRDEMVVGGRAPARKL